jgi:type IX secretion system PorP/SprF family membrane protein
MKKLIYILFTAFIANSLFAQQLPQYTQYLMNDFVTNPAIAGSREYFDLRMNQRFQWVGVQDAPVTFITSVHGPLVNKNVGLGGYVFADITGPTRRNGVQGSYAYHLRLSDKVKLSMGLSAGVLQFAVDASKIIMKEDNDIALSNGRQSVIVPDAGAGLYLYSEDFFVSISAPQMLSGARLSFFDDYINTMSRLRNHYFAAAGYKMRFGENFVLQPAFQIKYIDPLLQWDAMLRGIYQDNFWLGVNYRHEDAFGIMVGYSFLDNYNFAYSYDVPVNNFRNQSTGSHEVMLSFRFIRKK